MRTKALAYQRVYQAIKEEILASRYAVGTLIPTEGELEKEYEVSRSTIRKAIKILTADGYLSVKQGRGTMVQDFAAKQNYNQVNSVTESLKAQGYDVQVRKLYIEKVHAPESEVEKLNLGTKEYVAHFQRVLTADGYPICIMENYIPYRLVPGIEKEKEIISLYKYLEAHYQFCIARTKDIVRAMAADFYTAGILDIDVGTALLRIERICFDEEGTPVSVDKVKILGSRYEVVIEGMGRKSNV